ncbi:MAG: AzlC family ABC transporter permease [Coriobacteriia bacterium]|nr:AzlC family ABC transporter permease [Coriobacteriia bacterium]
MLSSDVSAHPHVEDRAAGAALHGTPVARFRRGLALGFPIFLGYMPVGMAFGILARTLGFSVFEAVVCSATALAGAGQFIALSFLAAGAGPAGVLIATTVVNLRYVLFASTLSTYLRDASTSTHAALAFSLTDETFAVNVADHRQGLATPASMAGVGAVAWAGWVLGTLVGALGAGWIGDPSRFGVGFAMAAMFTALFLALAEDWRHVVTGLMAGAIVLGLPLLDAVGIHLQPSWYLVIAAMVAASVGSVVWRAE